MSVLTFNNPGNYISREEENFEMLYVTNNPARAEESNDHKLLKHFFDINSNANINGWECFRNELEFE